MNRINRWSGIRSGLVRYGLPLFALAVLGFSGITTHRWIVKNRFGKDPEAAVLVLASMWWCLWASAKLRSFQKMMQFKQALHRIWLQQVSMIPDAHYPSVLIVNNAFEQIVASKGQDAQALHTAISFVSRLAITNGFANSPQRRGGGKHFFSGFTPELGTVHIQNTKKTPDPHMLNESKHRIGGFKVWRSIDTFFFQEYWRSDVTTANNPVDPYLGWCVIFDPYTLAFQSYGILEFRKVLEGNEIQAIQYGCRILVGEHVGTFNLIGLVPPRFYKQ